jgi:hypothetical protein
MKKFMASGSSKLYLYLILICVLALTWHGGELVNQKLSALPIKQMPHGAVKEAATDAKAFYPVWVKQVVAVQAESISSGDVDDLFNQKVDSAEEAKRKESEPDFRGMVAQSVQVQAIGDNGAVLNGTFYKIGSVLTEITLASGDGAPVVPVLASLTKDDVTIRVNREAFRVKLSKAE